MSLESTRLGDSAVTELAALKALRTLNLRDTRVTDSGLKELAAMKGLRKLDLRSTRVTEAAVGELQAALPDCVIRHPHDREPCGDR